MVFRWLFEFSHRLRRLYRKLHGIFIMLRLIAFLISFPFLLLSRFIPFAIPFILNYGMTKLEQNANLAEETAAEE
jgi:hypothetical protein